MWISEYKSGSKIGAPNGGSESHHEKLGPTSDRVKELSESVKKNFTQWNMYFQQSIKLFQKDFSTYLMHNKYVLQIQFQITYLK